MQLFTDDVIAGLLEHSLERATVDANGWHDVGKGPGSPEGRYVKWHTISDAEQSVVEDVPRIAIHPLAPEGSVIYGIIYDVSTGRLLEVPGARRVV